MGESSMSQKLTPAKALLLHGGILTGYEQSEILNYQKQGVYYLGKKDTKLPEESSSSSRKQAYDDSEGSYKVRAGDHIAFRYEILSTIGAGSFGTVLKAHDHATGGTVAVKVVKNKRKFVKQAEVEVDLLNTIHRADPDDTSHVIHLQESFWFRYVLYTGLVKWSSPRCAHLTVPPLTCQPPTHPPTPPASYHHLLLPTYPLPPPQ